MIGVRVKIMPPDAIFPDKIKIVAALPKEEKEIAPPAPAEVKPAPVAPAPEPEPEQTVVAKEVADETSASTKEEAAPEAETETKPEAPAKTEEAKQ
jgi:hypothetical protein